ncbi:C-type lectin domain family 4 member G [Passer domesticus]|uniref:C-type lectin domain family 4 member G n=1 Tax=Passer domesticus TaxID=48849 RepID=UPI0030FED8E5
MPGSEQGPPAKELLCRALGGARRCGAVSPGISLDFSHFPDNFRYFPGIIFPFSGVSPPELLCRALGGSRRCGPGWRPHGSSCYSFSRDALSWGRARNACADLGAHLAVVNDGDEQLFLVQNSNCSSSCWLGLTAEQEGKWRWVTGQEPTDTFWDVWRDEARHEAQELQELHEAQRCGALGPAGRWLRAPCAERRRWICERRGGC